MLLALFSGSAWAQTQLWTENFESYTSSTLSSDWGRPATYGDKPCVLTGNGWASPNGQNSLELRSGSNTVCMVVLPQFDKPLNTLTIQFNYAKGSAGATCELGYVTNASSSSSFTSLVTLSDPANVGNSSYTSYTKDLSEISGTPSSSSYRLAFKYTKSSEDSWYFDNFVVSYTESGGGGGGSGDDDCAEIGTVNTSNSEYKYGPVNDYYKYSYYQIIYPKAEVPTGLITSIGFNYAYSTAMSKKNTVTIYMGTTSSNTLSDWMNVGTMTKVYTGDLNCTQQGWNDFTLTTPYAYSGSENLVVVIMDQSGQYDGSSYKFYYATSSNTVNKYIYADGSGTYITFPSNDSGTPSYTSNATASSSTNYPVTRFCTEATSYPLLIASVADWEAFCDAVNGGHDYNGQTVTMTANVTTAVTTMAGTSSSKPFRGTFDGQGHTLNVNISGSSQGTAPFMYLDGATIQNLTVTGSVSSSNHHAGGLVGFTYTESPTYSNCPVSGHDVTIQNCHVSVNVTATNSSSNNYCGGIIGHAKVNHTSVIGCVYDGTISSAGYKGGIIGWCDRSQVTINDTYFNGTNSGNGSFNPVGMKTQTQNDNNVTVTLTLSNFYHNYTGTIYTSNYAITYNTSYASTLGNMLVHTITGSSTNSVTVAHAYTANAYSTSGITVYKNGTTTTPGMLYNNTLYAGNGDLVPLTLGCTVPSGQEANGYTASNSGSISGSSNPYTLTMPNNNTEISANVTAVKYHIAKNESSTAMTWAQFAAKVSGGKDYSGETIYLDEDITTAVTDMAGTSTDVQVGGNAFKGTFDGQGHTLIIGLAKGTSTHTAPFVYINGATIKDLIVEGEINIGNNQFAGGLVGISEGTNTITNCKVNVTINSTKSGDGTHGGFISLVQAGTTTFNGCAFTGKLLGANTDSWGGYVGYQRGTATLNDCVFVPQQLSFSNSGCSTFVRNGSNFNNCYYTEAIGDAQGDKVYSVTPVSPATVAMSGTASPSYDVSGLGFYTNSFTLTNSSTTTIYAKGDATLSLTLGGTNTGNYDADHGTLTGSGSSWSLAMEAYNTQITASACYPLSNLSADGATLTWDGDDASYIVELGEEGTTTEIQEILNESFEGISGVYNSAGSMPDGWYSYTTATGTNIVAPHVVNSGSYCYPHTGSGAINMESGTNATASTGNNAYVVLPLRNNVTELSFYARCESTSYKTLKVGYVSEQSASGCNGFSELKSITLSETVTQYTLDFVNDYTLPSGKYIAFLWNTTGSYYACGIDDVVVKGNVEVPTTVWTPVDNNATSPYTFTGLTPGGTYLTRVVNTCGQASNEVEFTMPYVFTKTITAYTGDKDRYYLIASPLAEAVAPTAVGGMITNEFDLYYFDQAIEDEWINYETANGINANFGNLVSGKGFLYASESNTTLTFTGTPYSGEGEVNLTYSSAAQEFPGWNLIGNPFATAATLDRPFYKMNADGNGFTTLIDDPTNTIAAMEGVFVEATTTGETATFTPQASKGGHQAIAKTNIVVSGNKGQVLDNAIIRFDGGQQLGKFSFRANSSKVYMPKDGKDYAIVSAESHVGEMPVNFKAESNGTYTLSFTSEEVSFAYLHLIDNMTGIETDLLANPSYSFEARTTDYESRFKLVFATGNNANDDNFAFFSNGSFVINNEGEATLQVIDINGRILKSESINGCANVNVKAAAGVYMLRLVNGNDVKVQKVVVR
jgi:hypothetical protein